MKKVLSRFHKSLFDKDEFTLTFELVPSRGGRSKEHTRTLALARELAEDGRFQAVSITENAGGHAALSPEVLGAEIRTMGLDVIVHFSCKDKNRNQMESLLFAWDRIGLRNLLVITGDYPKKGYLGHPKPVFDLGSVHALDLISRMNKGKFTERRKKPLACPPKPTKYLKGVAISPFKRLESELAMQYFKLHRKFVAGADYAITQVGYDARKFHEVLLYTKQNHLKMPILGNVFIPNLAVADFMYRGEVPGCEIPEKLYNLLHEEARSPDKGKKARLARAAKLLAVLKGMGYDGAHIGGPALSFEDLDFVLSQADELESSWHDFVEELSFWHEDGFYIYEKDATSGLNIPALSERPGDVKGVDFMYALAKIFHNLMFEKSGALYRPMKSMCLSTDESRLEPFFTESEHFIKFLLFGCKNCGDCTLADLAFLCPQSGCAKYLFNGPCGGSRDGWCEVYPGKKKCLFVRLYDRLKKQDDTEKMKTGFIPPRDWSLNATSSWINFYSGRDHSHFDDSDTPG